MTSRYEVYLNGIALSSLSTDIVILDTQYLPPSINIETYAVAKRQGSTVYRQYVADTSVVVSFAIRNYDIQQRRLICSDITRWAKNGGMLQLNDREGQHLYCICATPPVISSALQWTDPLNIVFTAYSLPFWEEDIPAVLTLSGTNESGTLYVPGNVDGAMVEVDILANASLSSVALTVNDKTLQLSGLSVSSGETIKIMYDDHMIQSIKVGNTSLLNKRSGVDDLIAKCGETNNVSFTASASADVTFKMRGLWY